MTKLMLGLGNYLHKCCGVNSEFQLHGFLSRNTLEKVILNPCQGVGHYYGLGRYSFA
jgi:hypothetical protein